MRRALAGPDECPGPLSFSVRRGVKRGADWNARRVFRTGLCARNGVDVLSPVGTVWDTGRLVVGRRVSEGMCETRWELL